MYNSIASADIPKFTSIHPSSSSLETSELFNEVVQIQNSFETVESTNFCSLPHAAQRYQSAVTNDFWDVFKKDLSREEFYNKFKELIFSNWDINESLAGNDLLWFCKDKSDTVKYYTYSRCCFEAELKNQAMQIIGRISRILETDLKIKHFDHLEKTTGLDKQQCNQQKSLPREKTRSILIMTEYYCKIYDNIYRYYFENTHRDLTNISSKEISKFIKEFANRRNATTKRIREIKPFIKPDLLKIYSSKVEDYLVDLDKSSERSALSISTVGKTSLQAFGQAEPTKSELNGKKIDANQGRLFDIIESKIKEKGITATDRDYILNPKHGKPARYYYSKIPITDIQCKKLLIQIKIKIINLIKHERESTQSSIDKEIARIKLAAIDTIFIEYIQSVLEHQKYTEITYSERKNTIQEGLTLSKIRVWINNAKRTLIASEKALNDARKMLDKECTEIDEEKMVMPYLLQYLNTKGEELIYNELSQPKYRELIGIQVRKKEETLTAAMTKNSDIESFLDPTIDMNSLIALPSKEYNKEDLNIKERKVLNSLYEKMHADQIITEIPIRKKSGSLFDYYAARKQFYLNWYQVSLLELHISLANFIISEEHKKIAHSLEKIEGKFLDKGLNSLQEKRNSFLNRMSISKKNRENRFLTSKALNKAEKFARHALRFMAYADLLESTQENAQLSIQAQHWMHVSPMRMGKIETKLNTAQENLKKVFTNPRMNRAEFDRLLASFLSSKILEKALVALILNIPDKPKSSPPISTNLAANKSSIQIDLSKETKRAHDQTIDEAEPKAKKLKPDENDDDTEQDSDLLVFLNGLHNSGLTNMNLAEDLMIDNEFVDSLLSTDVSNEQLIEDTQLLSQKLNETMLAIAQKSIQNCTEINFKSNHDFHFPSTHSLETDKNTQD